MADREGHDILSTLVQVDELARLGSQEAEVRDSTPVPSNPGRWGQQVGHQAGVCGLAVVKIVP